VLPVGIGDAALGLHHQFVFADKLVDCIDGLFQEATGIGPQVQDQSPDPLSFKAAQSVTELLGGVFVELGDPDVAHSIIELEEIRDAFNLDGFPDDGKIERFSHTGTGNRDHHLGTDVTAHQFDGFVGALAHDVCAVHLHNPVSSCDSHPVSGRTFDGGDHRDVISDLVDLDAQATKGPAGRGGKV